ncbi:MAG TPA: hypothetical protein VKQ32_05495 [Polyangia bacterium]|nr:hypothetical protein [Polyangia bacterium]
MEIDAATGGAEQGDLDLKLQQLFELGYRFEVLRAPGCPLDSDELLQK